MCAKDEENLLIFHKNKTTQNKMKNFIDSHGAIVNKDSQTSINMLMICISRKKKSIYFSYGFTASFTRYLLGSESHVQNL